MREEMLKPGTFGWFELVTTDAEAAKKFYSSVFGWETEDMPMEGGVYTMVKVGGEGVGGIMRLSPDCPIKEPCWNIYVTVADVDATAKKVKAKGGKLLREPQDIPGIGRFCVIQDPQGAAICAITYARK